MTRPHADRDPLPREPWTPTSSEWARKAALKAAEEAVRSAKDRRKPAPTAQDGEKP